MVSLLTDYISVNKFNIVCLSETFLNSEILTMTRIYRYLVTVLLGLVTLLIQTHDNFGTFMKNFELNLDEINKKVLS